MYKRRIKIFMGVVGLVFLVVVAKLGHLQIGLGKELRRRYEESIRSVQPLPGGRGKIIDRRGRILAVDRPCRDFCLDYRFLTRDPKWIQRQQKQIERAYGVSKEDARRVYERRAEYTWRLADRIAGKMEADLAESVSDVVNAVQRIRRRVGSAVREEFADHPIVTGLDAETGVAAEAEIDSDRTVGASIRPSHKRFYPYGGLACHIIGFTGPVTREELDDPNVNIPDDRADWLTRMRSNYLAKDTIGKAGVEKMCERRLRGRRGYRLRERSDGRYAVLEYVPAGDGGDVHLTLDIKLQEALTERMMGTGHNGSAVVLSVPRGEVLAMVSVPVFDLNNYRRDSNTLFRDDVDLPLLNRAVTRRYPPGSTIKPLVALAGLSTGRITLDTPFHCSGRLLENVPNKWRCAARWGHADIRLVRAIKKSCNVYFYHVGQLLAGAALSDWFLMFGLGSRPGTGLPEEDPGLVPTKEWLAREFPTGDDRRHFRVGDARNMAIGQGYLAATPLQVANAIATIARDGRFLSPLLALEGGPGRVRRDLPVLREHLAAVRKGMYQVVNEDGGTGYQVFRGADLGVKVCGKTGTATTEPQRADLNRDGKVDRGEIVREGSMGWFVGFAPYEDPKIAFAVVVEYVDGGGSVTAGPVAVDLVRACKRLGYLD
ncbi:MAG TPA: penicillin-binding transpeptidase domain-containing protein [Phycisphaerae bacterium]|nr:penicillin-binding transpeptidase domain-containing protein [Phycisphaerae bacterium]